MGEFLHSPFRKRLVHAFDLPGEYEKGKDNKGPKSALKRQTTTVDDFLTKYSGFMQKKNSRKVFKQDIPIISPGDGGWEWHDYDRDMIMQPYMSFMTFIRLISIFFSTTSRRTKVNCT